MFRIWRVLFVCGLSEVLSGCDDPKVVAQREVDSVVALGLPNASVESIRGVLTQRGYKCVQETDPLKAAGQPASSVGRSTSCSKNVASTLVRAYRIQVSLSPRDTATEINVHSSEICL